MTLEGCLGDDGCIFPTACLSQTTREFSERSENVAVSHSVLDFCRVQLGVRETCKQSMLLDQCISWSIAS